MSPRESDLRAALRHGEGDGLNPTIVVQRAQQARRHRRRTIAAVSGSVVAVAAVVTVVPILASRTGPSVSTSAMNEAIAPTSAAPHPKGPPAGAAGGGDTTSGVATILRCPDAAPTITVPTSISVSGQLFPQPVDRMLVCVFQQPQAAGVASRDLATSYTLTGPEARTTADRLNALTSVNSHQGQTTCGEAVSAPTVVIIARDSSGRTTQANGLAGCSGLIVSPSGSRSNRQALLDLINRRLPQPGSTSPHMSIGPGPS